MGPMFAGVLAMGLVAAMDRTAGQMRRKMAWTALGAASACLVLLVLQPIGPA